MGLTVTAHVAVLLPLLVVTVMVVDPAFLAVTTPVLETSAILSSSVDQVTDLSVALDGATVAVSV